MDILTRVLQSIRESVQVNQTTSFGVDVELTYVTEGAEFRIYKTKEIAQSAILWETIVFNQHDAEEKLMVIEAAIGGILQTGEILLPQEELI